MKTREHIQTTTPKTEERHILSTALRAGGNPLEQRDAGSGTTLQMGEFPSAETLDLV